MTRLLAFCLVVAVTTGQPGCECVGSAKDGIASWYSRESCAWEGTGSIMANGKELNDDDFSCACRDWDMGDKLRVTNRRTGKYVICVVENRGPSWKLYRQGRIVDLTPRAFSEIADIKEGLVKVRVEKI